MSLKIGIAQTINSTDLKLNYESITQQLKKFEGHDVDLILFPECSLSGFSSKILECTTSVLEPYLKEVQAWSSRTSIQVVLPTALVNEGKTYNSGFFFSGETRQQFFKIGLTESEKRFFSVPIHDFSKFIRVREHRLAILICFEAEHAPWTYFAEGEVDAILWPGYWGWTRDSRWDESTIFKNLSEWRVPLIQANFAINKLEGHTGPGPEGLSHVVGADNRLVHRGAHLLENCFIVQLTLATVGLVITEIKSLE